MKKADQDGGGVEDRGSPLGAIELGRRAGTAIQRSERLLILTWAAVLAATAVVHLVGFSGREGFAPILLCAWLGFPAGIVLGLWGQALDFLGTVLWMVTTRRSPGEYAAACGRGSGAAANFRYALYLVAFWALLPLELFCCFPVVC